MSYTQYQNCYFDKHCVVMDLDNKGPLIPTEFTYSMFLDQYADVLMVHERIPYYESTAMYCSYTKVMLYGANIMEDARVDSLARIERS